MSSNNLTLIFNSICTIIFLFNIYFGYKHGFFKTIIKLISGIIAFFLSLNFAPVFAKAINLTGFLPKEYLLIAPFINQIIFYVLVYIIVIIALKIIGTITEIINKTPIIGFFNKVAGAAVSFIYSFAICAIISIIISLPVFSFKEAYESSFFKPINTVTVFCLNNLTSFNFDFDTYTDEYKEKLYNWLTNNEMIDPEGMKDSNIFDFKENVEHE